MTTYILKTIQDTVFKEKLLPTEDLSDDEKKSIPAGKEFAVHSYLQVVDHLRFTLQDHSIDGYHNWYVYMDDIQLLKDGQVLPTLESPAQKGHGTSELCRRPPLIWDSSPNFSSRNGTPIRRVILHCTATNSLSTVLNWFRHPESQVSAHYVVSREGKIYQMVRDSEKAWHAYGENADSIGIEHVADVREQLSPLQEHATLALIRWLMAEYNIPPYAIMGHHFSPSHSGDIPCPHHLFGDETDEALRAWVNRNLS